MPEKKIHHYRFLHTSNKVQKINATNFSDPAIQPYKVFVPHRADFHMIHLFTHGHGDHYVDFKKVTVKPGYILFIAKGQIQDFDPKEPYDGKSLIFTEDFFCRSRHHLQYLSATRLFNDPLRTVYFDTGNRFEDLVQHFDHIINELKRPVHEHQSALLHNYLFNIMLISEMVYRPAGDNQASFKNRQLVADFKREVNLHLHKRLPVEAYAKKLNTTLRTLQAAFAQVEGTSPKAWLSDRTVLEIKRKLTYEQESIKEIAHTLNFKEPTNLTKFFKAKTGLLPSTFKRSLGPTA